jgi:hypothetical protein
MITTLIDSNDHDYLNLSYTIVKLTKYNKTQLNDHDFLLADDVKMSFMYKKDKIYKKFIINILV